MFVSKPIKKAIGNGSRPFHSFSFLLRFLLHLTDAGKPYWRRRNWIFENKSLIPSCSSYIRTSYDSLQIRGFILDTSSWPVPAFLHHSFWLFASCCPEKSIFWTNCLFLPQIAFQYFPHVQRTECASQIKRLAYSKAMIREDLLLFLLLQIPLSFNLRKRKKTLLLLLPPPFLSIVYNPFQQ